MKKPTFINAITFTAVLMALWFIMSQKTEPKFLIIGAVSSFLIALLCTRTLHMEGYKSGRDCYFLDGKICKKAGYLVWLLIQIVKSALYVSRISLSDRSEVDPSIAYFKADYDSPFARALLANSITLTPGTITIDITDDGIYSVHALTRELREGLLDGSMQKRIADVFGDEIDFREVSERDFNRSTGLAETETEMQTFRAHRKREEDL